MYDYCEIIRRLATGIAVETHQPERRGGPREAAGADFADVVPLGGDRVALVLGDVWGQGLTATRCVPQALRALRLILSEQPNPARALGRLNRYLCNSGPPTPGPFVSLSLAVVDGGTGEVVCSCAGSEPPLILRASGGTEVVGADVTALEVDAGRTYQAVDFFLAEGDALLLASDGVTEARKPGSAVSNGLLCGDPLCRDFLRYDLLCYEGLSGLARDAFCAGGPPRKMARAVLGGAQAFAGGVLHDDACVLVAARQ